jgi:hypothetical protein
VRSKLCVGLLVAMAGGYILRRQGMRRGATDEEFHKPLPGDEVVPHHGGGQGTGDRLDSDTKG